MSRFDNIGLFWEDLPSSRKRGERQLGPMPDIPETGWRPVASPADLPDWRGAAVMSIDTETYDPELTSAGAGWARNANGDKGHIVGMSLAIPGQHIYVPIRHEVQAELNLPPENVLQWMDAHMQMPCPKVGANIIYDIGWLEEEGVTVNGELFDVQYAQSLLDEESKVSLEDLAQKYLNEGKVTDLLKKWCMDYYGTTEKTWRRDIYRSPVTLAGAYGEADASLPLRILEKQWPLLDAEGLLDLFKLENSLIPLLIKMRRKGVTIDGGRVDELNTTFITQRDEIQATLDEQAGMHVEVSKSASLKKMFDKHGISYPIKHDTGNPSFTKEFLENHPHELPQLVTKVRALEKLRGTFIQGYLTDKPVNGKLHGTFIPLKGSQAGGKSGGAKTGRLASQDPNLQNIPARTKEGKLIRQAFIMDKGHAAWYKFDYSQIEYRLLAHFAVGSGSDLIRQAYIDDPRTDYHSQTATLIKEITGIELSRSHTKNINFGLAYGMGLAKLAKDLGVSMAEAKALTEAYHKGVPFAKETMKALSEFAQNYGYNLTILGRRTRFNLWEPSDFNESGKPLPYERAVRQYGANIKRAYLYRTLNYTLQGSSADMMKKAMAKCYYDGIFDVTGIPRLTVHDELDFSVEEETPEVLEAFAEMKHIMETVIPLRIPVICDAERGPNWGDVKEEDWLPQAA